MAGDVRQRLTGILTELTSDAPSRRAMRRHPAERLARWGLAVPAPPGALVTNIMGRSAWLGEQDLLGRVPSPDARAAHRAWMTGSTADIGLLLCAAGARPLALVMLPEPRAEAAAAWAREQGLGALLGPLAFEPEPDPGRGGFADLTRSEWAASAGSGGWRSILVSPSDDFLIAGWLSLLFGWTAWLGVLLGYPHCCATAFDEGWRTAPGGDVSRGLLRPAGAATTVEWTTNPFVRVLGATLPLHFPCRSDCDATRATTPWLLAALAAVDPMRADRVRALLHAAVIVGADGETHALQSWRDDGPDGISYDAAAVVSSAEDTPLARMLRTGGHVSARSLSGSGARLVLPGAEPANDLEDPEEVVDEVSRFAAARGV